jgi:hypothetical protein
MKFPSKSKKEERPEKYLKGVVAIAAGHGYFKSKDRTDKISNITVQRLQTAPVNNHPRKLM